MFTVPKKDSENRGFFFNLKELNKFIANYHFKMVVFEAELKFVKQNVMMASVGLRDRYIVKIHEEDRKYLRFICKKKVLWENLFTNENFLCSKNIYDTLWNPSLYFASYWFLEYFIYWWFFLIGDSKNEFISKVAKPVPLMNKVILLIWKT